MSGGVDHEHTDTSATLRTAGSCEQRGILLSKSFPLLDSPWCVGNQRSRKVLSSAIRKISDTDHVHLYVPPDYLPSRSAAPPPPNDTICLQT